VAFEADSQGLPVRGVRIGNDMTVRPGVDVDLPFAVTPTATAEIVVPGTRIRCGINSFVELFAPDHRVARTCLAERRVYTGSALAQGRQECQNSENEPPSLPAVNPCWCA